MRVNSYPGSVSATDSTQDAADPFQGVGAKRTVARADYPPGAPGEQDLASTGRLHTCRPGLQ